MNIQDITHMVEKGYEYEAADDLDKAILTYNLIAEEDEEKAHAALAHFRLGVIYMHSSKPRQTDLAYDHFKKSLQSIHQSSKSPGSQDHLEHMVSLNLGLLISDEVRIGNPSGNPRYTAEESDNYLEIAGRIQG